MTASCVGMARTGAIGGRAEGVGGAKEAGLDDARVRGLIQDEQGTLWAATGGRGLLRFVPQSDGWQAVAVGETAILATAMALSLSLALCGRCVMFAGLA